MSEWEVYIESGEDCQTLRQQACRSLPDPVISHRSLGGNLSKALISLDPVVLNDYVACFEIGLGLLLKDVEDVIEVLPHGAVSGSHSLHVDIGDSLGG